MADITKDNVRAYVKALISREFKSNKEKKGFSDNRNRNMDQCRNGQHRSENKNLFMEK